MEVNTIMMMDGKVARIMAVEDGVFASWRPEDVETYLTLTERYLTAFREGIQNLEPEQEHQELFVPLPHGLGDERAAPGAQHEAGTAP